MPQPLQLIFRLMPLALTLTLLNCEGPATATTPETEAAPTPQTFARGTYGYDLAFLQQHDVGVKELIAADSSARIMIIPDWQGRVMTSSAAGLAGKSYGWINYDLIAADSTNGQFNPFGGEERFWLGPEGGPFSLYFDSAVKQDFTNWRVPPALDTEAFTVESVGTDNIVLTKATRMVNASGNALDLGIRRSVSLLGQKNLWATLELAADDAVIAVGYETENTITNQGATAWSEEYGFASVWLLCMFNPSEAGVVFIPVAQADNPDLGPLVKDDYFGKVPADRLKVSDGTVFFRVDGKQRGKIGIPPNRALPYAGGYDPLSQTLTIVTYNQPEGKPRYVNSAWGEQDDPLDGDVVNSYNDGPVADGSIMGPFYEIESSSPAALLRPGEQLTHRQRVYHFKGTPAQLDRIVRSVFDLSLTEIAQQFS
ncbi:MAG: DUF6786 family protein [Bacteroidota bacterium]